MLVTFDECRDKIVRFCHWKRELTTITMKPTIFLAISLIVVLYCKETEATVCAPYSNFQIDCNRCVCSKDGTEYTCTRDVVCTPRSLRFDDDDFVLPPPVNADTVRARHPKSIPYVNDEIELAPSKRQNQEWQEENDVFVEVDGNNIPSTKEERYSEGNSNEYIKRVSNIEDVSMEEQNAEEIEDNDLVDNDMIPDRFKLKRSVKV